MAVAFRSASTATASNTGSRPSGAAAGDVFVAVVGTTTTGGTAPSPAAPTGWTRVAAGANSASLPWVCCTAYYIAFTGSDPTYTWTDTGSEYTDITIAAFTGVNTTTPVVTGEHSEQGYDTTTPAIASINTAAGGMLVGGLFTYGTTGPFTPPGGMSEASDFDLMTMVYETVSAGATGSKAWTLAGADFSSVAGLVLQASGGGGGGGAAIVIPVLSFAHNV